MPSSFVLFLYKSVQSYRRYITIDDAGDQSSTLFVCVHVC